MAKSTQTPISVLKTLMDEYQLTPFSLAKAISLSPSSVRQIVTGMSKVTVPTALRLAKFFGQTPVYWLDLQRTVDLNQAENDQELQSILDGITKAQKPAAKGKSETKSKSVQKDDSKAESEKQKKTGKAKGAKPASRKAKK